MKRTGFALTELIIVIAIIGILLGIVSLNFSDWQRKNAIEKQTRELFTEINNARTEAIFRKLTQRVTFQPSSYVFKRYSTDNEAYTAGTTVLSRNLPYLLSLENGDSIADRSVEFNMRGLTTGANFSSSNLTLRVNPANSGASVDCIIIHIARTNLGKMNNGNCTFK